MMKHAIVLLFLSALVTTSFSLGQADVDGTVFTSRREVNFVDAVEEAADIPPGGFSESGTIDLDGDGWYSDSTDANSVDCCDSLADGCPDPYFVNPGAWEIPGNGVDDNCNGVVDELEQCDPSDPVIPQNGQPPAQYPLNIPPTTTSLNQELWTRAMDICQEVQDDDDASWGVMRDEDVWFSLTDARRGTGPFIQQYTVQKRFGQNFPQYGRSFATLSTGTALMPGQWSAVNPGYAPGGGTQGNNFGSSERSILTPYTGGGNRDVQGVCGVTGVGLETTVNDGVRAGLTIRSPTNARGFALDANMLSNEMFRNNDQSFPLTEAVCNANTNPDMFLLLVSAHKDTPHDTTSFLPTNGNVALFENGHSYSENQDLNFWQQCIVPGNWNAPGPCKEGINPLRGSAYYGGSGWKTFGANLMPRQDYDIQAIIFDGHSDGFWDSTILLDHFRPVLEARSGENNWGYRENVDIGLHSNKAVVSVSGGKWVVQYSMQVRNWGPGEARDIWTTFSLPAQCRLSNNGYTMDGGTGTCDRFANTKLDADKQEGAYHCNRAGQTLKKNEIKAITVSITCDQTLADILTTRMTVSCSSPEVDYGNNYMTFPVLLNN